MDEVIEKEKQKSDGKKSGEGISWFVARISLVFALSVGHDANYDRTMEPNGLFEGRSMQSILIWKTYFWNNNAPPFSLYFSSALSLAHASMHVCF